MCDQTEIEYLDGEVVWVKLGSCWWPGEVVGADKLPPDVLPSFRKAPIAVVKFFQEDAYEYVKNINSIYKYNCSRKDEFIKKGLDMYRTKHGHMEKFPEDVIRAESATGGDTEILTRDEFQEIKKESYAGIFGDSIKKNPSSAKKGRGGRLRHVESPKISTPTRKFRRGNVDYKVHILLQGSKTSVNDTTETESSASTSQTEVPSGSEESTTITPTKTMPSTPTIPSSSGIYSCHSCSFTTSRLNVMILHNKSHSVTFSSYTPSPIIKKSTMKTTKPITKSPGITKTPKVRKPRKDKSTENKKLSPSKRKAEELSSSSNIKKSKTDEEIKSSLLADWDDMDDESPEDEERIVMATSPEIPARSESPAIPSSVELAANIEASELPTTKDDNKTNEVLPADKPDSSSDLRYEFCEDEDWPLEADLGRKIPRVKNALKQKLDSHRRSLDENDVVKEVADLLDKTTVPELPSAPEPLKVEENFPEPTLAKSPDKPNLQSNENGKSPNKTDGIQTKTIFKTKTFFRSRHSRSQDVIGKYVAEQLNAAEKMDSLENEINGSETTSSPEARDSPPIEHVKVARLAPKIQLKKMKAEAAQLIEKSISNSNSEINPNSVVLEEFMNTDHKEEVKEQSTFTDTDKDKCALNTLTIIDGINEGQEIINKNDKENVESNTKDKSLNHNINLYEVEPLKESYISENDIEEKENQLNDNDNENTFHKINDSDDVSKVVENRKDILQEQVSDSCVTETATSTVDTLLSVSHDSDRVTKMISNDPPEDLFEDDIKADNLSPKDSYNAQAALNGGSNEITNEEKSSSDCKSNFEVKMQTENDDRSLLTVNNSSIVTDNTENKDILQNESFIENIPTESDLQVAEALINLPSTGTKKKTSDDIQTISNIQLTHNNNETNEEMEKKTISSTNIDTLDSNVKNTGSNMDVDVFNVNATKSRYETEEEKSENLNAAQSLVQMSETLDHKLQTVSENNTESEVKTPLKVEDISTNKVITDINNVDQKLTILTDTSNTNITTTKSNKHDVGSSKLLQILEEPCTPKPSKVTSTKSLIIPGKEKIINFDVKTPVKGTTPSKQKIIIRRATPSKNIINNLNEPPQEKIVLSRTKPAQDGSSIQTYTIQASPDTPPDSNTIIITQNIKKIAKPPQKLQTYKSHTSTIGPTQESKSVSEEALFDINSMPIVLSDDIVTPENIEKMPIVMSDGNIITNPTKTGRTKQVANEKERLLNTCTTTNKSDIKTLLINTVPEVSKASTPNILSKSSKLKGSKPMLIIDKSTGKQKIIMAKSEPTKEVKQTTLKSSSMPQTSGKTEKYIILPATNTPRPNRTQKIVIDPQTGKAHVLIAKSSDTMNVTENKPVSAKLIPSAPETGNPGGTVMIITNAQGTQSRIVLTPEHEKILFPNKQQSNVTQIKSITQRQVSNTANSLKQTIVPTLTQTSKTQTKIVSKQKNSIITSKGQLIVGGRLSNPNVPSIAPMPEIRPAPSKRIIASDPTKITQTIQKSSPGEPLIFLQQKSGTIMQLTAAQFEHLQRTGQIVQKTQVQPAAHDNKVVMQKSVTITSNDPIAPLVHKQKNKSMKSRVESPIPTKKFKQEINIAPAPTPPMVTLPPLTPLPSANSQTIISTPVPTVSQESYADLENLEELLPSTAIARQPETIVPPQQQPEPAPTASLSDGQLLAVPGEHFGGPANSFYLCVEDNGTLTPIDNRPLVLENNQLVPMAIEPVSMIGAQPERRDILEAALANSDVFHAEVPRDDAPDFRDLNANVSVHCRVSETSTTLNQPIMTPVEVPTKGESEPAVPSNLEDGLAVIGVTPQTVPTSLELPITVTDPRIAPKTTDPLCNTTYGTTLVSSPNTEMFVSTEESEPVGPISMPILTEEDDGIGKSMPILTDEVNERTASSVDSTVGSPSSIEVRESEVEEGPTWSRRLLTPGSDSSETSAEIPLQPAIQLSVNDLQRDS